VVWAGDGETLFVGAAGSGILRWAPSSGTQPQPWLDTDAHAEALAIDPGGDRLAWAGDKMSVLVDVESRAELHRWRHEGAVASVALGPTRMTSVDRHNRARSYDYIAKTGLPEREVDTLHAISIAAEGDGPWLATGGYGAIEVRGGAVPISIAMPDCRESPADLACADWEQRSIEEFGDEGSQPASYTDSSPDWLVHDVEFGPNGQMLVAGRSDGVVLVVDLAGATVVQRFEADPDGAVTVSVSRDASLIAVGGKSGRLDVFSRVDGSARSVQAHEHSIRDVAWSGPGQIATASYDGVAVWQIRE